MKGIIRLIAWCLAITLVILPVAGVLTGRFAADRWPVTRLTAQAEFKHVTPEQLSNAVRPLLGKGFFAVDLDAIQKAVAALPWVASAEASKSWPDTLVLRVHEQQPFASWNGDKLISRQGTLFAAPGVSASGLPDLRGPDARLAEVVAFYADVQRVFARSRLKIAGVALTERGSWSLLTSTGAQIVLGDRDQAGGRLRRFLDAYPQMMAGHSDSFSYVDLRYTNGFAVRWSQTTPAVVPPAAAGAGGAQHA